MARTLAIGVGATIGAVVLALPTAMALVLPRGRWTRAIVATLIVWPLLAPPCVIGYAWTLLATQDGMLGGALRGLGWNSRAMAPVFAAWVQAAWLWPIPALFIAAAFRLVGRPAYRLALLDATPVRAFFRAGLPAISGALVASAAVVFLLSIQDSAIPPLLLVTTWPSEMMTEVVRAASAPNPTAFLATRSWPILAATAIAIPPLFVGLRRLWFDRGTLTYDESGPSAPGMNILQGVAVAVTTAISLLPMTVFIWEFGRSPESLGSALDAAWRLYPDEFKITGLVCVICAALGVGIGLTALRERNESRLWRMASAIAASGMLLLALFPPAVIGRAMISAIDREWGVPAS
ncbi:MAG: hypothetical protein V3T70_04285, partial [Phycisphaerae bacterium]